MAVDQKILVVYFSRSGKTRMVADSLSQKLNCESLFVASRPYTGLRGYARALLETLSRRKIKIEPILKNLETYDLVLIGSPIWASAPASPIREFLRQYHPKLKKVGFFLTQAGTRGSKAALDEMQRLARKAPICTLVLTDRDLPTPRATHRIDAFVAPLRGGRPSLQTA